MYTFRSKENTLNIHFQYVKPLDTELRYFVQNMFSNFEKTGFIVKNRFPYNKLSKHFDDFIQILYFTF